MCSLLSRFSPLPDPTGFELGRYEPTFSLHRLTPGVDNIRYDVQLSPDFHKTTESLIDRLLARHGGTEGIFELEGEASLQNEVDHFRAECREVFRGALDQAKYAQEIQVDYLARVAVIKMLLDESEARFSVFTDRLSDLIWKQESGWYSSRRGASTLKEKEIIALKEKLAAVKRNRGGILNKVRIDLFTSLRESQASDVYELRRVNFGDQSRDLSDLFDNILLAAGKRGDPMFMAEYYVLLGERVEDPDRYDSILLLVKDLLKTITTHKGKALYEDYSYDALIKEIDNFDLLFNCFETQERFKALKEQRGDRKELSRLKGLIKRQQRLLDYCYEQFKQADLVRCYTAFYEMQPLFPVYCPPLSPAQVIQFVVGTDSGNRRADHIRRLQKLYGQQVPLTDLHNKARSLRRVGRKNRLLYLLRYLKDFCRYYRDQENSILLWRTLDHINLVSDTKTINLSSANNTLYSFLLSHEAVLDLEDKPLINHTIVKADIRGATEITHQLMAKGLNPASYFSLNFFEPINEVLAEFGATKIFIEGDAMILALGERKDSPAEWYSVARACGLALNILRIIQQCNNRNRNNELPPLEVGCGICFSDRPPAYLFDGDKRILISLAINLADRLSSSAKSLRGLKDARNRMFNLYVFQPEGKEKPKDAADDYYLRFNVNGIEVNAAGFEKLRQEICLKEAVYEVPGRVGEEVRLYTGTFPTISGKMQRLAVREATIIRMHPDKLQVNGRTEDKYYEVLNEIKLYNRLKTKGGRDA